jgi:hypothetical protein
MENNQYYLLKISTTDSKKGEFGKSLFNKFIKDNDIKIKNFKTPIFYTENGDVYMIFLKEIDIEIYKNIWNEKQGFITEMNKYNFIKGLQFVKTIGNEKIIKWLINPIENKPKTIEESCYKLYEKCVEDPSYKNERAPYLTEEELNIILEQHSGETCQSETEEDITTIFNDLIDKVILKVESNDTVVSFDTSVNSLESCEVLPNRCIKMTDFKKFEYENPLIRSNVILKQELFDEDNMKLLLNDEYFNKSDRSRLSNYNKNRNIDSQSIKFLNINLLTK